MEVKYTLAVCFFAGLVFSMILAVFTPKKEDNRPAMMRKCLDLAKETKDLHECVSMDATMNACYGAMNKNTEEFNQKQPDK